MSMEPIKVDDLIWKCPICGFAAMSKKVIENHIRQEHPSEARSNPSQTQQKLSDRPGLHEQKNCKYGKSHNGKEKPKNGKDRKEKAERWAKFKVGDTKIKVLKRPEITIKDQMGWRYFLTANYVASLHKQRVRVKLITGEEFEGLLKGRDPYFVTLKVGGGRKLIINKAHIIYLEPL